MSARIQAEPKRKEWPFIFSGHSVRQMLAGAKTQTRRLVGPRTWSVDGGPWPKGWKFDLSQAWLDLGPSPAGNVGPYLHAPRIGADTIHRLYPLVQVGHCIRAREAWVLQRSSVEQRLAVVEYEADRFAQVLTVPHGETVPIRAALGDRRPRSPIFSCRSGHLG